MKLDGEILLNELVNPKVHFIGIGGAGMSGIARIMLAKGFSVSGSDKNDSSIIKSLKVLGAEIQIGHSADNIKDCQLVIVSSAILETNPELVTAKQKGIQIAARAQALAWLMSDLTSIAVAGTHGKTTTTAMLTVALQSAGLDPSFAIGGTINTAGTNAHNGSGSIFIAEADESDGSFLAYKPSGAIITNVELDHVDHFADEEAVFRVFEQFIDSIKEDGFLVACGDDLGVEKLLKRVKRKDLRVLLYGEGSNNDFKIERIYLAPTTSVAIVSNVGRKIGELNLAVVGKHNLLNALAAFAAGSALSISEEKLLTGLKSFTGTRRRFELKGEVAGIKVIDDYGHHPTEIEVTLTAARRFAGEGRVIVVFQPHRYSRTKAFIENFATALDLADEVIVLEIYAASEKPITGISSEAIVEKMTRGRFIPNFMDAVESVVNSAKPGDVIITLGAGDVSSLAPIIVEELAK